MNGDPDSGFDMPPAPLPKQGALRVRCIRTFIASDDMYAPNGMPKIGDVYYVKERFVDYLGTIGYRLLGFPCIWIDTNEDAGFAISGFEQLERI
jgi:hypothetical protein